MNDQTLLQTSPGYINELLDNNAVENHFNVRILTTESNAILRVDFSEKIDGSLIWERNLDLVSLSLAGSKAYKQTIIPLSSIKYAYDWARVAISGSLNRTDSRSMKRSRLSAAFSTFHNFVVWCARNGITDLSTINRSDTDKLLNELALNKSWDCLLNYSLAYTQLLNSIVESKYPVKAVDIFTTKRNSKSSSYTFKLDKLSEAIGLPAQASKIPYKFTLGVGKILKSSRISKLSNDELINRNVDLSIRTFRAELEWINDLGHIQIDSDGSLGMDYVPFPFPNQIARKLIKKPPTSYVNLKISDAIKLLTEARRWVEIYSVPIIELYKGLGEKLFLDKNLGLDNSSHLNLEIYFNKVYPKLRKEFGLPHVSYPWNNRPDGMGFIQLIQTLQTACAVIIGINHGRRHNEVMGEENRPFGLYENCVTEFTEDFKRHEIRIYIEKTVRDWIVFPANNGVKKAVEVLESLLEVGKAFTSQPNGDVSSFRKTNEGNIKLFQYYSFITKKNKLASSYLWHEHSTLFFKLANVDSNSCNGIYHSFRRIFAQVYFYRFENADIRALAQWFGHFDISNTFVYVHDPASREDAERIEKAVRLENESSFNIAREFGREYLHDCLLRLLEAEPSGGGFSQYAIRVFRSLAKNANFPHDTNKQVEELVNWFVERGYEPEPLAHAVCLAGDNNTSKSRGKCYNKNTRSLNKYKASPDMCCGCPHAYTNSGYLESNLEEIERLNLQANDVTLPLNIRQNAQNSAIALKHINTLEQAIQSSNKKKILAVYELLAAEIEGKFK